MRSHVGRLYALSITILVFMVSWAMIATRPWEAAKPRDPRLVALDKREEQLRAEAARIKKRWARYTQKLAKRDPELAALVRKQGDSLALGQRPVASILATSRRGTGSSTAVSARPPSAQGPKSAAKASSSQAAAAAPAEPSAPESPAPSPEPAAQPVAQSPAPSAPEPAPQPAPQPPPEPAPAPAPAPVSQSGSS